MTWNKDLSNEKTKEIGRKMAVTRKKNGWFRDIESFRKKRRLATLGQNNPMSHSNQSTEKLRQRALKVAETRRKKGSYVHTEVWKKQHSLQMIQLFDKIGRVLVKKYPDIFNTELKTKIRKRDDMHCQLCDKYGRLSVHHIDYNKDNSDKDNLITLCGSCHSKTNFNRKVWFDYFYRTMRGNPTCGRKLIEKEGIYYYVK